MTNTGCTFGKRANISEPQRGRNPSGGSEIQADLISETEMEGEQGVHLQSVLPGRSRAEIKEEGALPDTLTSPKALFQQLAKSSSTPAWILKKVPGPHSFWNRLKFWRLKEQSRQKIKCKLKHPGIFPKPVTIKAIRPFFVRFLSKSLQKNVNTVSRIIEGCFTHYKTAHLGLPRRAANPGRHSWMTRMLFCFMLHVRLRAVLPNTLVPESNF